MDVLEHDPTYTRCYSHMLLYSLQGTCTSDLGSEPSSLALVRQASQRKVNQSTCTRDLVSAA